jgi:hypothetical protein
METGMNNHKRVFIVLTILFLINIAFSQDTFIKYYGDSSIANIGYDIMQTYDGNYAIAGGSNNNYRLLKIDPEGNELWSKTYGGSAEDIAYSFVETPDHGFILSGYSNSLDGLWLVRTNEVGDTLWTRVYQNLEAGNSICELNDNCYVVTGGISEDYYGDVYVLKFDIDGDSLWLNTFYNCWDNHSIGKDIALSDDSGFVVLCYPNIDQIKFDQNGNEIWRKNHNHEFNNLSGFRGNSIFQTADNGYIIAGNCTYTDPEAGMFVYGLIIKTDFLGDTLWTEIIGSVYLELTDGLQLENNNYIITGAGVGQYSSDESFNLIKLDSSGNVIWRNNFGDGFQYVHRAYGVVQTPDHGFIMSGMKWDFDNTSEQYLCIVKTDSLGQVSASGINDQNIVGNFTLSQNYPNPFNPITTIGYVTPEDSHVKLTIYNISGQHIGTLVDEFYQAGAYRVKWDASKYSSGIYIYRLESSYGTHSRKMVLIK